ncbi:MAG TPA: DNA ligase D [Solirubrobacteraceae bacterium]|nr:DNA ligase D [Solirubrobacteraceae bacterium]
MPAGHARGKPSADGGGRLGSYSEKRDFAATPEPTPGRAGAAAGGDRFVIQEHHARRLHWDLRLEHDGVLASWALPKGLPEAPGDNRFAASTEDHPIEYLDFEGEIPRGQYGAGRMTVWDSGTYECLKWEPRKVEVALHGSRVEGRYALFPIEQGDSPKDWMIHRMDPPADPAREPMPEGILPMLARAGELPSPEQGWAYEIKWDGVRALAYCRPGELRLESRNLLEITDKYPELAELTRTLGSRSAILDGEIVAFGADGRPSFSALQRRMQVSGSAQARRRMKATPVTYVIFDLLWLEGRSLTGDPYSTRRERLAELGLQGTSLQVPDYVVGHGRELLRAATGQGLEGVVAKRLASVYQPGRRTADWVKIKRPGSQEFVVGGWLPGKGSRSRRVGALLLGVHDEHGSLRYAGRVGSGFSERELDRLAALLGPLASDSSPFSGGGPPRGARFCEPRLVAEVSFSEWTPDGRLRHPVYLGLREDKPAVEVVREDPATATAAAPHQSDDRGVVGDGPGGLRIEHTRSGAPFVQVEGRELKLSNLDKVLYPDSGFTKGQLIDYYVEAASVLLPHLSGRPLTVTRWPDGVQGKSFFQKQAPAHRPDWVSTATVPAERKRIDYVLADDLATLVWLANLAAVELHTPLARSEDMERPTSMVFDLDPGAPATAIECCRVALTLHGTFERLGLQSFAKTSGSKGLQVYVPLNRPDAGYRQTKTFARTVAELLEQSDPELVVSRMTKSRRAGKVLIDWSQNDARKTTVCAYSLRAVEGPGISTPVSWEEVSAALDGGDPARLAFTPAQVLERIAATGDLFAGVLSLVQSLPDP